MSSSVGILCMIVPLYQAELAHPSIRGRITALQQFMLGVGALAAAWISYGMTSTQLRAIGSTNKSRDVRRIRPDQ
jgi:hypothetical protein